MACLMIRVHQRRIGACDKSEKLLSTGQAKRLVIEWTTQLATTRRAPAKR